MKILHSETKRTTSQGCSRLDFDGRAHLNERENLVDFLVRDSNAAVRPVDSAMCRSDPAIFFAGP